MRNTQAIYIYNDWCGKTVVRRVYWEGLLAETQWLSGKVRPQLTPSRTTKHDSMTQPKRTGGFRFLLFFSLNATDVSTRYHSYRKI